MIRKTITYILALVLLLFNSALAGTYTPVGNLYIPAFGESGGTWWSGVNDNFDKLSIYRNVNEYASFNAAVTAIGATELTAVVSEASTLTANTVVPATMALDVKRSGYIDCQNTYTVDIRGPFDAGDYQVFKNCDPGDVTFASNNVVGKLNSTWLGAIGDNGTTNNYTAIKSAIDAVRAGGTITFNYGTYVTLSEIPVTKKVRFEGPNAQVNNDTNTTIIKYDGAINDLIAVFKIETTGSAILGVEFINIALDSGTKAGYALYLYANNGSIKHFYMDGGYFTGYRKQALYIRQTNPYENSESLIENSNFFAIGVQPDYAVYSQGSNISFWRFKNVRFDANSSYRPKNHVYINTGVFYFEDCVDAQVMTDAEAGVNTTDGYAFYSNGGELNIDRHWSESGAFLYYGSAGDSTQIVRIANSILGGGGRTQNNTVPARTIYFNHPKHFLSIENTVARANIAIGSNVNNEQINFQPANFITSTSDDQTAAYLSGTHRYGAGDNQVYVEDEDGRDLQAYGAGVGQTIYNWTDGSFGVITAITNGNATRDRLTVTLVQGTDNDWDDGTIAGGGDQFRIYIGLYDVGRSVGIARNGLNQDLIATYLIDDAADIYILSGLAKQHRIIMKASPSALNPPSGMRDGDVVNIIPFHDSVSGHNITWSSDWKFAGGVAPTIGSGGADSVDYLQFIKVDKYGLIETNRALDVK